MSSYKGAPLCGYRGCHIYRMDGKPACRSHMCGDPSCPSVRQQYNRYCLEHSCPIPGCRNIKFSMDPVCTDHQCRSCGSSVANPDTFSCSCKGKKCEHKYCSVHINN